MSDSGLAPLILGSGSPRRRELLAEAGYAFRVLPPDDAVEAAERPAGDVAEFVARLARVKAHAVAAELAQDRTARWVLAADTVAELGGEILGKPRDLADARRILEALSGRRHRVLTGVCLVTLDGHPPVEQTEVIETLLEMSPLTPRWLNEYLASEQWRGKAGAFGYQDGLGFVRINAGSPTNVVGLPMERVTAMLECVGCRPAEPLNGATENRESNP